MCLNHPALVPKHPTHQHRPLEDRTLDLPFSGAAINERMYQDKTLPTKLKRRSHSPPSQELSPYMAMQLRTPAWLT